MASILICDDDQNIHSWFQDTIRQSKLDTYGCQEYIYLTDPEKFCKLIISGHRPDMIFMDLVFHKTTGIETIKTVQSFIPNSKIILISSSKDYYFEGYSIHAYDYLIKPLSACKVLGLLDDLFTKQTALKKTITLKIRNTDIHADTDSLMYIESNKHSLFFHFTNQTIKQYGKIDDYHQLLENHGSFIRCHQSYLVNIAYIHDIDGKNFIMKNNNQIPIRKPDIAKMKAVFYSSLLARGVL